MSGLERALAKALGYYLDTESERPALGLPSVTERAVRRLLADPAFRKALTRALAEALHDATCIHDSYGIDCMTHAATIVARLTAPEETT